MADYTKKLRDDIALLKEQKNLLEASAEHTKRYGFEVSKGKTRLEEFNKKLEEIKKLQDKIYGIEVDKASLGKEINNITKKYGGNLLKTLKIEGSLNTLKAAHNTKDKELLKQSKDYASLLNKVLSGEADSVDLLEERKNFSGKYLKAVEEMQKVLEDTPDLTEKLKLEAAAQAKIDAWGNKIKETSTLLSSPKAMGVAAIGMAVKLMTDFVGKAFELRQSLGTSAVESARLAGNMTAAGLSAKAVGGSSQEAEAAVTGLVQEFGSLSVVSAGVSAKLGLMTGQFGISGANAAKLLKSMEAINGASIETNLNLISSVGELARAEGVAPAQVLNDIAESTETFAQFAKDGGQNIAKAAIEARKLGLNLGTVAGIAESLLDFESSIEKEMEASVLLGRQLNLDKARELALTGDLEGLAKEVKNQVGSQAEFEAMNVVQRKALADAMGVTVADMGKMVAGEKTSAQIAEERVETEKKQADIQMVMMGAMVGMQSIQAAMITAQTISAMLSQKKAKSDLTSAAANVAGAAAESGKSAAKVPIIGAALAIAAIAAVGAAGYKLLSKKPPGMEAGGVVKKSGMAEVHKGEAFSGTKNEMGFGTDMRQTNKLIRELITQNAFLMGKMNNTMSDMKLA